VAPTSSLVQCSNQGHVGPCSPPPTPLPAQAHLHGRTTGRCPAQLICKNKTEKKRTVHSRRLLEGRSALDILLVLINLICAKSKCGQYSWPIEPKDRTRALECPSTTHASISSKKNGDGGGCGLQAAAPPEARKIGVQQATLTGRVERRRGRDGARPARHSR
jgi:hypothetical protein